MKKYLSILLLIMFIAPSVVFASWWNPHSWHWFGLFSNKDKQTTVSPPIITTIPEITQPIVVPNEDNVIEKKVETKITPKIIKPVIPKIIQPTPVVDVCPNIDGAQQTIPDGMYLYKNINECLTTKEIDIIENLSSEYTQTSTTEELVISITDKTVKLNSLILSWETSTPSESKVIFEGRAYFSKEGIGTKHSIAINNLNWNTEYKGTITAIANNAWASEDFTFTTEKSVISEPSGTCMCLSGGVKKLCTCGASA